MNIYYHTKFILTRHAELVSASHHFINFTLEQCDPETSSG